VLHLSETGITDAGLAHLAGLKRLRRLTLEKTNVTNDGLKHLAALEQLARLDVKYTQVTEGGLQHLKGAKRLRSVSPFGRVESAWFPSFPLKEGPWATSADGKLSLRLMTTAEAIYTLDSIPVIAELRNNTDKPVDVLRPFGHPVAEGRWIDLSGPDGKVRYSGDILSYALGAGAFSTISGGEVIRDRLELTVEHFTGSDMPGKYEISFTYAPCESDRKTAANPALHRAAKTLEDIRAQKTPRDFAMNIWVGQLRSRTLTVTKDRQPEPID